jgi:hypothetical protein
MQRGVLLAVSQQQPGAKAGFLQSFSEWIDPQNELQPVIQVEVLLYTCGPTDDIDGLVLVE